MRSFFRVTALLAVLAGLVVPAAAKASTPVPWNQCRGLQYDATLFGRPPGSTTHFCSARQQLGSQDLTDYNAVRRTGDAEQFLLDRFIGDHSAELPSGTLHSIGDVDTTPSATQGNPNGTNWDAQAYVYSRSGLSHGKYCHVEGTVEPITFDGLPSWDIDVTDYNCKLTY